MKLGGPREEVAVSYIEFLSGEGCIVGQFYDERSALAFLAVPAAEETRKVMLFISSFQKGEAQRIAAEHQDVLVVVTSAEARFVDEHVGQPRTPGTVLALDKLDPPERLLEAIRTG